ncbi:MAG: hypothetical protein DBY32_04070 [Phascolarctobacterium sp.]|nr:MAG: hypothetical protein DBY32_04070 [Phascolarctobacterium sp.]
MNEVTEMQYVRTPDREDVIIADNPELFKFKKWFSDAVDAAQDWREEAREDRNFYEGRQWRNADKRTLEDSGRPAITINRIKPLLNVLSGYQRLNRYDIDFLPRTNDDMQLAQVRKGVTKYIMDRSHYNYEESDVFMDGVTGGIGWFEVGYKWNWEIMDGDAFVRRVSPFDIYIDPESRDKYFRDMKYLVRARWVDKEALAALYPEHKEEIEAQMQRYLSEEKESNEENSKLWYQYETKKIRFAECWYKTTETKTLYTLDTGEVVAELSPEQLAIAPLIVVDSHDITVTKVMLMSFFDNVVLEAKESPYQHGEFPFVPFVCYYMGDDDMPAGIVRDLKDPQREINKRRSQELHILNTQSNGGWITEEGALTNEQESDFRNNATKPGAILHVAPGALTGGRIQRLDAPQAMPVGAINAVQEAMQEMPTISGINEALMGTDISSLQSGRAIELKQKQAITHIASLFDNLRYSKEVIATLLWGRRGAPGIIPQFYTEEKTYRIIGPDGQFNFITVNQQVQSIDPNTLMPIRRTLNDLSAGEFDIVIADTPATATQRTAQFWSLVDACGKLGINGNMVLDILLDLSDVPQKEEIKRRLQQQQQQAAQAQQQQMQMQMEIEKQKKLSRSMAYKDLQLPLQLKLAAEAGIFPKEYADAFMEWSVQQYAAAMGIPMGGQPQQQQGGIPPQVAAQLMAAGGLTPPQQQPTPQAQRPLTQAAINGLAETGQPVL